MSHHGQSHCTPQFTRTDVTAEPIFAAQLRHDFSDWLQHNFNLDQTRAIDVVLAVNEALANAAESAYVSAESPGAMHLQAEYDPSDAVLVVTVADEGAWRVPPPGADRRTRGRGIPLMQALADRVLIDPTPAGTRVRLEWNQVAALDGAAAQD